MQNCNTPTLLRTPLAIVYRLGWLLALWSSWPASAVDTLDREAVEAFWQRTPAHQFIAGKDGVSLAYKVIPRPNALGSVVIFSGRTESFVKYQEFAYEMAQAGYAVYQHDHRGQGLSSRMLADGRKGHVVEFDDYVVDADTFMRSAAVADAPRPLYLFAHSMGGAIAIRYLATHDNPFAAVVLGSPMLAPNTGIAGTCQLARAIGYACSTCAATGHTPTPFAKNRLTHSQTRFSWKNEVYEAFPGSALGAPTFGWVAQACEVREQLQMDAADIRGPLLLLQAGDDKVVLNEPQNAFCARENAEGKPVCDGGAPVVIDGARHELLFESDEYRAPVLEIIRGYYASHRPSVE